MSAPSPTDLTDAVELLERAVAYTRGTLAGVTSETLGNATPCRAWDLGQLLDHLDDSLDAFTRACSGAVVLVTAPPHGHAGVLPRIHARAGALLGAWTAALSAGTSTASLVRVGDRALPRATLVGAGALEVAVHGWDVAQATGLSAPIPESLAARLLPLAHQLVAEADRPRRFATPTAPSGRPRGPSRTPGSIHTHDAAQAAQLLGFLGRIA